MMVYVHQLVKKLLISVIRILLGILGKMVVVLLIEYINTVKKVLVQLLRLQALILLSKVEIMLR
jgi:hypothetical protein